MTEKRGRGLVLFLVVGISFLFAVKVSPVSAKEENALAVTVRNGKGQKVLIRYDAIYPISDVLKLELPLKNFEKGGIYELRLECTSCETEEKRSRTFYLKSLEQQ